MLGITGFLVLDQKELVAIEAKLNFNKSGKKHLRYFADKYECKTCVVGLYGEKRQGKYVWELVEEIKGKVE